MLGLIISGVRLASISELQAQHWHALQVIPFCVHSQKPADRAGHTGGPAKDQDPERGAAIQASPAFYASSSEPQQPWPWPHPGVHPHSTPPSAWTLQYPCFPWARAEVSSGLCPLVGSEVMASGLRKPVLNPHRALHYMGGMGADMNIEGTSGSVHPEPLRRDRDPSLTVRADLPSPSHLFLQPLATVEG